MVGIVIVAHSRELADGVAALAAQMTAGQQVPIAAAGGLEDGSIGTSLERIQQAMEQVYREDGVLVLMDLGSAVMTTEMLLEMLPEEQRARIRMSNAALVEGAIAAAAAAAQGADLDQVQRAAETAMDLPKIAGSAPSHLPEVEVPPAGSERTIELVVPNPVGLHARPAAQFVQTAARFRSRIRVQNVTQQRSFADAKSMMQVASQATARQGERIRIVATGEDADEAILALQGLVESGFGEMEVAEAASIGAARTVKPDVELQAPSGPPPYRLSGIGASEGAVVAPALVYRGSGVQVQRRSVDEPQAEVARFRQALARAVQELEQVQEQVSADVGEQTGRIFEFHRLMLQDPELVQAVAEQILAQRCNAEAAVDTVISEWAERFAGLDDAVMQARAADVRDVGNRLLAVLTGKSDSDLSRLPGPVIVIAADLVPSETALLDRTKVLGLATALGGETSHTAILARMLGIPAVVGLGASVLAIRSGMTLALDGGLGLLEVEPSRETRNAYKARQKRWSATQAEALQYAQEPAITEDGRRVEVVANVGNVPSAQEAMRFGAEGVGLLRTEFLYLERSTLPDEDEQFGAYRDIAQALGQSPLIVRTLDVGGDKQLPYLDIGPEMNPFLGLRAIRLCLERPDIFQPQLRAILRVAVGHNVKIMFPMVTTRDEILRAKEALRQAASDLGARAVPHAGHIEVGIMVETPASAILAPVLAEEVDFFSIGSNDLTQYVLAADRGNERLMHLYRPLDPAVLQLIHTVIQAGHAAGKWVGLCGELAGHRNAIPILLGLGLDEFSMTAHAIPLAKRLIRRLTYAETQRLAAEVLTLRSAAEVEQRMAGFLREIGEE
ncbi:MAG: phosphoenolpyruvate--protein phosphotransferase [Chloroflexi bacterium]|nr:phosphoenolpyruvate--protein phosphotransferase [Chloroflexota bacterium]